MKTAELQSGDEVVVLAVPFREKDEAKKAGAWWSPELKRWYVPRGKDPQLFEKWFLKEETHGNRAGQ